MKQITENEHLINLPEGEFSGHLHAAYFDIEKNIDQIKIAVKRYDLLMELRSDSKLDELSLAKVNFTKQLMDKIKRAEKWPLYIIDNYILDNNLIKYDPQETTDMYSTIIDPDDELFHESNNSVLARNVKPHEAMTILKQIVKNKEG